MGILRQGWRRRERVKDKLVNTSHVSRVVASFLRSSHLFSAPTVHSRLPLAGRGLPEGAERLAQFVP